MKRISKLQLPPLLLLFTSPCASFGFFHNKVTAVSNKALVTCVRSSLNANMCLCVCSTDLFVQLHHILAGDND